MGSQQTREIQTTKLQVEPKPPMICCASCRPANIAPKSGKVTSKRIRHIK